jgi:parallel beta-helix repeat protein
MKKRILVVLFFLITLSYSQLVVNTELDTIDAGDGLLSLREAVIEANTTAGQQSISFEATVFLPGANRIIYLKYALQLLDEAGVIINGAAGKVTLDGSKIELDLGPPNGLILEEGNNQISNLYLQNFSWAAILVDSQNSGDNIIGPNNKISQCQGAGIMIIDSENNTVTGNNIWNCGFNSLLVGGDVFIDNQDGIMLITDANNNIVEENNIWANYGSGIGIYMSGQNTLTNNYIVINELDGIYLYADSGENVIEENKLLGNELSSICIYEGSGNTISGNSIGDTTAIPFSYLQAKLNMKAQRAFTMNENLGSRQINNAGDNIVPQIGNRITDVGIQLWGVNETEIAANNIIGCDYYGIDIEGYQKIDSTVGMPPDTTYLLPEGILIENNHLERNNIVGINVANTLGLTVRENYISLSRGGIQAQGLISWDPEVVDRDSIERGDFIIENNMITSLAVSVDKKANALMALNGVGGSISLNHLQTAVVTGNQISKSAQGMSFYYVTELAVQSNILQSINSGGIQVQIVDSSDIRENQLANIGNYGIYIYNGLQAFTSSANIIDNNLSEIGSYAIACTTLTSLDVIRNRIFRTGQSGIYIYDITESNLQENEIIASIYAGCSLNQALFLQFENNELYGNGSGIFIGSSDSILIQNNTISRNNSSGLSINTTSSSRIANNFIFDNGGVGISMNDADTCVVESNYVAANNYGYYTYSPSGQLLRSNTFQGNTYYGVYCDAVEDSLDARQNYWGHPNGPATSDTLYPGIAIGDRINATVIYQPFLTEALVTLSVKPVISEIKPNQSPEEGGGSASIYGRQFMPDVYVVFNSDTLEQVEYVSSDLLVLAIPPGTRGWRDVIVINPGGLTDTLKNGFLYGEPTVLNELNANLPRKYALYQNYPNPFNPVTTIRYDIVRKSRVELIIYNTLGQKVTTLVDQLQNPGRYTFTWNAGQYPSGVYFYVLRSEYFTKTQKLVLIK